MEIQKTLVSCNILGEIQAFNLLFTFSKPLNFELNIDDMELTLSNLLKRAHLFRWMLAILRLKFSVVFFFYTFLKKY